MKSGRSCRTNTGLPPVTAPLNLLQVPVWMPDSLLSLPVYAASRRPWPGARGRLKPKGIGAMRIRTLGRDLAGNAAASRRRRFYRRPRQASESRCSCRMASTVSREGVLTKKPGVSPCPFPSSVRLQDRHPSMRAPSPRFPGARPGSGCSGSQTRVYGKRYTNKNGLPQSMCGTQQSPPGTNVRGAKEPLTGARFLSGTWMNQRSNCGVPQGSSGALLW